MFISHEHSYCHLGLQPLGFIFNNHKDSFNLFLTYFELASQTRQCLHSYEECQCSFLLIMRFLAVSLTYRHVAMLYSPYHMNGTSFTSVHSDSWSCLTQAARYLSTFPYSNASNATAKTGHIINQQKSGFVDSVGGVKPTCSSSASNKLKHYLGTKLADWRARFPRLRPNEIVGYVLVHYFINVV